MDPSSRRSLLRTAALATTAAAAGAVAAVELPPLADRRLSFAGPASSTVGADTQHPGRGQLRVVWTVETDRRLVALTFDDGPAASWTPMVLDMLERHGVPATFFLVGERVRTAPALVRGRLARHEVGNHSWAHHDLARMSAERAYEDLRKAHAAIAEVTGREPRLVRPPYGHLAGGVLYAAARMDYLLVLWSLQMREWAYPDPLLHARHMVESVRPGSIVLGHDVGATNRLVALRGLPDMISGMRARGFEFVTVSTLLG